MKAIIAASPEDAPALKALLEAGYRGDSARRGWNHEADILDDERIAPGELEAMLADPAVTILTARDGDTLTGCVAVTVKDAALAYLGMLCVAPDLQSAGVGRQLLDAAEDHARGLGIAAMEMTVIDSRASLIAWYERRGYLRTGETRPFPVRRDPPLTFAVLEKRLRTA
ncbi:GNAT family N-acetyltransferase [Erythrobacter dokdonensis]|uniref:GCN5-related N-acetyltransferase n=1 Tax=Erythrobacter dokdonensis DSW-74 TaxID=1300349 RepID=A0A1A7BGL3_9SPHN|nr:GNAT family N-acetyltransferase [Erythrobacter dokdonensis]OBV11688.1 GCN5-related N-acetyltransferase [Erythrobacter dokdonensis DSW-74]